MPRRARLEESEEEWRRITIHKLYYGLLVEICYEKLQLRSIAQCLGFIIKDLYDTIANEENEETKKTKHRERKEQYKIMPPP